MKSRSMLCYSRAMQVYITDKTKQRLYLDNYCTPNHLDSSEASECQVSFSSFIIEKKSKIFQVTGRVLPHQGTLSRFVLKFNPLFVSV